MSPIKFPTKRIFPNFHILKINRMMSICNLFMERSLFVCIMRCFIEVCEIVYVRNSTDSHRWWSSKEPEDAVDTV